MSDSQSIPFEDMWRVVIVPARDGEPMEAIVQLWTGLSYGTVKTFVGLDAPASAHCMVNDAIDAEIASAGFAEADRIAEERGEAGVARFGETGAAGLMLLLVSLVVTLPLMAGSLGHLVVAVRAAGGSL